MLKELCKGTGKTVSAYDPCHDLVLRKKYIISANCRGTKMCAHDEAILWESFKNADFSYVTACWRVFIPQILIKKYII